jgi:transglutaminase-like putative cysteine protease
MKQSIATPPPLFLPAALLFWGWQHDMLLLAAGLALTFELARRSKKNLHFSDKDFNHIADFTTLLWIVVGIYLFFQYSVHGLFELFTLLPLLFGLLMLVQIISAAQSTPLSSIFLSLRRIKQKRQYAFLRHRFPERVDLSYPYILLCIISASVARHSYFFIGVALFIIWGLWTVRVKRYPLVLWAVLLAVGVGLGYAGQNSLVHLQHKIERLMLTWFEYHMWRFRDPYQQNTAIGDIGSLKQSNQILLRVQADHPVLLREASYVSYFNGVWRTPQSARFSGFVFPPDDRNWRLADNDEINHDEIGRHKTDNALESVSVSLYPRRGKAILPVPSGTVRISAPPGLDLQGNPYGAIKATESPGLLRYTAYYGEMTPLDSAPQSADFYLPASEAEFLRKFARQINIAGQPPDIALSRLTDFFERNFRYSLKLLQSSTVLPLEDFLLNRRAGHCEYFASSTVLLLRAAGIPARYAAGYAAQEYNPFQDTYLVRSRHAHAWAIAYLDGRWVDVDTTPVAWAALEEEAQSSAWQPFYDGLSWLYYQFLRLRWMETNDSKANNHQLLWLIAPLFLLLLWRFSRRSRLSSNVKSTEQSLDLAHPQGLDSAFFQVMAALESQYPRRRGQSSSAWLKALAETAQVDTRALDQLLVLHNRYRFDPNGLSDAEKQQLMQVARHWLAAKNAAVTDTQRIQL